MSDPKYKLLFEDLKSDLLSGKYRHGQKMPSESALVSRTGYSRITVSRAMQELRTAGLVERVAGSGTFAVGAGDLHGKAFLFGLLMPELGKTEILAPLCRAVADAPDAKAHALLWGNTGGGSPEQQALALTKQFIARGVDGVFVAPLEFGPNADALNRRVLRTLRKAHIAVVLLDRRVAGLANRLRPDLAALNHMHAGQLATECLLQSGCQRLAFVGHISSAASVSERRVGFERAVSGSSGIKRQVFDLESDAARFRRWLRSGHAGVVCVNDEVAGRVLHLLQALGIDVPGRAQVVGIDDAGYAAMLPTPLTTVRQPLVDIGRAALQLMLDRLANPARPGREVLLDGELIQRSSTLPCGQRQKNVPKMNRMRAYTGVS